MGVRSPFIGATSSPAISISKHATPELPLLETVDEITGHEVFMLSPPHLDLIEEHSQVASVWDKVQVYDLAVKEPPTTRSGPGVAGRALVPEWPSHLPSYIHEVTEQNTFLEVPSPDGDISQGPRQRAASDWSGVRDLKDAGFQVDAEELRRPLPPLTSVHHGSAAPSTEHESMPCGAQQWCWMVQDEATGAWMMMYEVYSPSRFPAEADTVAHLPPLPEGQEPYRPKWVYGSSWPFNHAPTTLILENLPQELTHAELLAVLDTAGFRSLYDFVFLPVNLRTGKNQGQAIVNFTRHSYGSALAARIHGFSGWGVADDGKPCQVKWSLPLQGLVEHIENYRNHPTMHESVPEAFRPTLFLDGWKVPFPAPTKWIRSPRIGHW